MSRLVRLFVAVLLLASAVPSLAWSAGAGERVAVSVTAAKGVFSGDSDILVQVTVTNTNPYAVKVSKFQLPLDEFSAAYFTVRGADGSRVAYTGPMVKRARPGDADTIRLAAGASLTFPVELTAFYDFGNGLYTIQYKDIEPSAGFAGLRPVGRVSLKTEARTIVAPASRAAAPKAGVGTQAVTYTGNCSASQRTAITRSVAAAQTYALASQNYFIGKTSTATARYTKWFGAATTQRISTGRRNFQRVYSVLATQSLVMDCSCKSKSTFAYVYPDLPNKYYLCGAFWSAPMTGTDSKAGTLIHETTHFTVVAGTDDYAYGQTDAASLALSNPDQALQNADNHEYFAENTPVLR